MASPATGFPCDWFQRIFGLVHVDRVDAPIHLAGSKQVGGSEHELGSGTDDLLSIDRYNCRAVCRIRQPSIGIDLNEHPQAGGHRVGKRDLGSGDSRSEVSLKLSGGRKGVDLDNLGGCCSACPVERVL